MLRALTFVCSCVLVCGLFACGNIDKNIDCTKICNRYKECFNALYDAPACITRCEHFASESNVERQEHADVCEACISTKSCVQSFACADECESIVP